VTGGSGFVGKALSIKLLEQGWDVCGLSRRTVQEIESAGGRSLSLDITDADAKSWSCFQGAEVVFHVAAHVGMWGRLEDFMRVNVDGTQNVLNACKRYGVKRLVYTSSPSVVADGTDLQGIDESYPYPDHYEAFYPQTKAQAERLVLAANSDTLFTCALRPHLIWGPGDVNFVPTILERAKAGKLIQVGAGENMVDTCYIEDCISAHMLAAAALEENRNARGKAYFISQGEPVSLWGWINQVLELNRLPLIEKAISRKVAGVLATICEWFSKIHPRHPEPLLTRFLVSEMATDHYFSLALARKELGFEPRFSVAEALAKTFPEEAVR
jgi:nucleoside-diphosphate-sugar epimerase